MSRRTKIGLSILVLTIIVLLALQTPILRATRSFAWGILVQTTGRLAGMGPLDVENDVLTQLSTLQTENARLRAEVSDYSRLREHLGSISYDSLRSLQALVVARPFDTYRSELIINLGAKDGVVIGAPVVTQGSLLIGYITDLHEHTAVVRLLLNPSVTLPAEVDGVERSQGLLRGKSFTSVVLTTVPRDAGLSNGQTVVTTATDATPHGLRIGTIRSVRNEENEAYQEVVIALPYDPDEIKAVAVLVEP